MSKQAPSDQASQLAPQLPYLRRYARALTGDQTGGDRFVRQCLEALIEDPAPLDQASSPRVGLFRAFHELWSATQSGRAPAPTPPQAEGDTIAAEHRVLSLSPLHREALLLVVMEGFGVDEAAEILGLDPAAMTRTVTEARAALTGQLATRILIIEDEPIIALDLEAIVSAMGHQVVGVARTAAEAEEKALREQPSLILADIKLADGSSGIDAVNAITETLPVPVIFITAYPEQLLTGDRPEPAFLITKPFMEEAVRVMISQVLFMNEASRPTA
ncbi:MAG: response regulator [Alphaproteobacteria bacterium]|jgi:DNA-directed RNA polymerase specialized sigma24 family protein|nr:response regulator [Alphaproteobacteria bacterium]